MAEQGRPIGKNHAAEEHGQRMRAVAHQRLDQLFDEAEGRRYGRFHGRIAVEVTFESSRPLVVHRRIEGTDK